MTNDGLEAFLNPDSHEQGRIERLARRENFDQKMERYSKHVGVLLSSLTSLETTNNDTVVEKIVDLINGDEEHTLVDGNVKQGGLTAEILRTTIQRLALGVLEQEKIIADRYSHLGFVEKRNALSENGEYNKLKRLEKTLESIKINASKYAPEVPGSGEVVELFEMAAEDKDF